MTGWTKNSLEYREIRYGYSFFLKISAALKYCYKCSIMCYTVFCRRHWIMQRWFNVICRGLRKHYEENMLVFNVVREQWNEDELNELIIHQCTMRIKTQWVQFLLECYRSTLDYCYRCSITCYIVLYRCHWIMLNGVCRGL